MKIQASSAHRILKCPYSLQLEQEIPEGMRNEPKMFASTFGRDMHDIGEKQLEAFVGEKKVPTINQMIQDMGFKKGSANYDKGFNAVNTYVKYIKKHLRKYKQHIYNILIEKKYKFNYGRYNLVAKMDCMTIYKKDGYINIDVFDLKTGAWDYSESAYTQMYFTALLVIFKDFPKEDHFNITIHTVQPNYWMENHKIVRDQEAILDKTPKKLLEEFLVKIHKNDTVNPEGYCRFCPSLLVCPAAIQTLIGLETFKIKGDIMEMTIKQLEAIQEDADFFKTFLKGVEEHLIENEDKLKKFSVKHNKKSKKLIKIVNPFDSEEI